MPAKNEDLHGNAPDKSDVALLLIDVINDLDFPEGDQLLRHALPMARHIADLKRRAKGEGVPVVYVNDNFGRWRSDFNAQGEHCLTDGVRGNPSSSYCGPTKTIISSSSSNTPSSFPRRSTPCWSTWGSRRWC